jgi:subtilisin family serine protease
MMMLIRKTILFLFLGFVLSANPQVNENMLRSGLRSGGFYRAWIFFNDKTEGESTSDNVFQKALDNLDNRTRVRRSKVRHFSLVDNRDIPVSPDYIDEIKYTGVTIRTVSKWLNAVSVSGSIEQLRSISDFPFVKKIDPVYGGKRKSPVQRSLLKSSTEPGRSDYGPSYDQLDQINVIAAHEAGYTGAGVRVLMLDTGYYTDHEAIHEEQVIAEWDFINNDGETQNEEGDPDSQHNHGTYTLSALGGRFDGELYGPAYEAEFLLAKTEDVSQEVPIEEDQYVAGLEWGESLGADIASSSLGYIDWYELEDLDGMTAVTTIAVNTAIENGMVVVTAVGNSGAGGIVVPADAENVIACGAVDSDGNIASFSSQGPTADGRIKPEVCALGVSTYCAGVNSTSAYRYEDGTSLATPLVAGAAACVLQAHPDWTPQQVREALMMTASDPENPDNQYGWGIIDVMGTINYQFMEIVNSVIVPVDYSISRPFPNPFNPMIHFNVSIFQQSNITLTVFDIYGKEVERLWSNNIEKGVYPIQWNADGVSSGVYFINLNGKNGSVNRKICLQK